MTDKGTRPRDRLQHFLRRIKFVEDMLQLRDAFMNKADALLRRVLRDCLWLSAITLAVIYMPLLLVNPLPAWHEPIALALLTLAFGFAVSGWAVAIIASLQRWPGLRLGLMIALPLVTVLVARQNARSILSSSFGVSADVFPMALEVITAVTTLWFIFACVGALLMLVLLGLLFLRVLAKAGFMRTFLQPVLMILPVSVFAALPLASTLEIMPQLPGLVRMLDGQSHHRCDFTAMETQPEAVTFLSDTRVLAWMPNTAQPIVAPCVMTTGP